MKDQIKKIIAAAHAKLVQEWELDQAQDPNIILENTKDKSHGDFACNIALMLAKPYKKNPREISEKLVSLIEKEDLIEKIEIAGPGFINFFLNSDTKYSVISEILELKDAYAAQNIGKKQKLIIEFVSANPTGPLHVGHGRHAAFGASVANILDKVGFDVYREYYVNDGGRQMNILTLSIWLRYLELFEKLPVLPQKCYQGEYVINIAHELRKQNHEKLVVDIEQVFAEVNNFNHDSDEVVDHLILQAKKLLGDKYNIVHKLGLDDILGDIKQDLSEFGVDYDNWFSEKTMFDSNAVKQALDVLQKRGHLYQKDGATWFKTTAFGDEKDRVVIRSNGDYTYFSPDIAYHLNKLERGFSNIADIFGADHHGYVPRIQACLDALTDKSHTFHAKLVQFVSLFRGDTKVQMSTRSGSFVTLRELREEVGNDAARFFYIMRKVDQPVDFDIDLAKSKSNENPVYYIQYAHARICSVFNQADEKNMFWDQKIGAQKLNLLKLDHEQDIVRFLLQYRQVVAQAADYYEPHRLAQYLLELATLFHSYYNNCIFLDENSDLRNARLNLCAAVREVIRSGLKLLGVNAPRKM